MDNRRTPNQPKASHSKSASTSKFLRPRSNRKLDGNSTILLGCGSHNASIMGSARNLNQTIRHNLDMTVSGCGSFNPHIKSSIGGASGGDVDLEYDLAYNEYLQALIKKQIVENTIDGHKEKLNDQILIQSEQLRKLESSYKDIFNKINSLKQQSEVVEVLDMLKIGMDEIESLCEKHNTYKRLNQLNNILIEESNLISIRCIKPISSKDEYDNLIATLHSLEVIMQKIINVERNFEGVNGLAMAIKNFSQLQETVKQTAKKVSELRKKAAANFIKHGSDMFAEQGGYF